MVDLHSGMLLVASPVLVDPNFFRSVVLLMDHDDEGSVGVVLDRPLEMDVRDHLPMWCELLAPPARVFEGGPVQPETAIGVAYRPCVTAEETWRPTPNSVGFIDVSLDPNDISGIQDLRVFSGYAGWGSGQLEMELEIGSWFPVDGSVDDVFDPVPTTLWRRVLLRQEPHVARYANYPIDLRSN
ncbi:MAG: YqgE/AlgH family protein [Actinomycetota bacterium]|nr:YqgE/AlgH family protein [Actinomycetota bacterium]